MYKSKRATTRLIFVAVIFLIPLACSLINPPTAEINPTATPFPYPTNWKLLLADNFNDNNNAWGSIVPEDEVGSISSKVENGLLDVTLISKEQGARNSVFQSKITDLKDFFISFEAEQKDLENDAYYGLEFRTTNLQGYVFVIDQKQSRYSLAFIDTKWNPIIDITTSTAIKSEKPNKIGLLINESKITMFINDQEIATISDSHWENSGSFGFTVGLYNPNEKVNVSFENLQIFGPSSTSMLPTPTPIPPIATNTVAPTNTPSPSATSTPISPTIAAADALAGRIEGRVYQVDANQPVFSATLVLIRTGEGSGTFPANIVAETTTDMQGHYYFAGVDPGPYLLFLSLKELPEYQDYPFCTDGLPEGWDAILTGDADTPIALVPPNMEFSIAAGDVIQKDIDMKDVKCK